MKQAIFNEQNFSVIHTRSISKLVDASIFNDRYEVYSYRTLMAVVIVRYDFRGIFEGKAMIKSDYYSATTARHIKKALGAISETLLRIFLHIKPKNVIEKKISFGFYGIGGGDVAQRIYTSNTRQ